MATYSRVQTVVAQLQGWKGVTSLIAKCAERIGCGAKATLQLQTALSLAAVAALRTATPAANTASTAEAGHDPGKSGGELQR